MAEMDARKSRWRRLFAAGLPVAGTTLVLVGTASVLIGGRLGRAYGAVRINAAAPAVETVRLARAGRIAPPSYRGMLSPWRVGVQVGHWKVDELPPELHRLHGSTGARYGNVTELSINLEIARRVAARLEAAGVVVDLLPATLPPGYDADALVAIHADGANRPGVHGWKIATAWRASDASRELRESIASSYAAFTGLPEDRYGTTYNMRGYYAFSPHRFEHAAAYTTPAVIIEAGFVTVARDREVLVNEPETAAQGISAGIIRFLSGHNGLDRRKLLPRLYPVARVGSDTELYFLPEEDARTAGQLKAGTLMLPVHREPEWTEVIVRGNYRRFGWVRTDQLEWVQ